MEVCLSNELEHLRHCMFAAKQILLATIVIDRSHTTNKFSLSDYRSKNMDNSQYICFCRRIFPDQTTFKSHLPCADLVHAVNKKANFDIIPSIPNEVRLIPRSLREKSETVIKIMKLTEVVPETRPVHGKLVSTVAPHLGKRLPSRTKVPFLSRAVPLSTDHSFERCTCGAVFVTRVGKRQHQARFCKLAKNSKNKINSNIENLVNIQTVSPSELTNEYIESEDSVINEIYDEQSVIHYEVDDNCV